MSFDITQYEAKDVGVLSVVTPQGAPLIGEGGQQVRIHVYGPGSPHSQKAKAEFDRAVQAAAFAALRQPAATADVSDVDHQAKKLAALTDKIEGLPITPAELYGNPRLGYITNQVVRFSEAWSNFLPQFAPA